ncbi:hypothetical protein, partial [Azospirillum sp. B506]|uniref:hypothetical protein n=1 Tax=Azospirillum sp. B506 TaxID=137721 RepID=UPI0005B28C9F
MGASTAREPDPTPPPARGPLHVDAAAKAALLVLAHGVRGIYNFAEDDGAVSSEKAKRDLQWSADWRSAL